MWLKGLSLQHFRNYKQHTFLFPKQVSVILGKNAVGKTSILEAIAILSTGESFRAGEVAEMIQLGQEIGRIKAKLEENELELLLTRGQFNGKKVQSRLYTVNGVRKRKKDFVGKFLTVVFRPEDLRLIEGSPSRRRQFIDTVLRTIDHEYEASLKTYEESLKRRNKLLLQIRDGQMTRSVLSFWTSAIIKHGSIIQEKRVEFFGSFSTVEFPVQFSIEYQPSVISEARMAEYAETEVVVGHTMVGPHKDDFVVKLPLDHQEMPIAQYGSRGQQRLAVLWLKMCEFAYLLQKTAIKPILLLDDILSELDESHQDQVFSLLNSTQSIITTTEKSTFEKLSHFQNNIELFNVEDHE
jgi:DNA replication and repair protein RecF